jgi:hypothetical protein
MSEALNDVRQRCEAVGIECEDDASSLLIWFPTAVLMKFERLANGHNGQTNLRRLAR